MIIYDDKREYNSKFLYIYKIPELYNSYENLSDYKSYYIIVDYFNNDKNLRKYESKANVEKRKMNFTKKKKNYYLRLMKI